MEVLLELRRSGGAHVLRNTAVKPNDSLETGGRRSYTEQSYALAAPLLSSGVRLAKANFQGAESRIVCRIQGRNRFASGELSKPPGRP